MKKVVLLIMDGLGDGPTDNGSLAKAKTPNIDNMKKEHGVCGGMITLGKGITPHSDNAHLVLFGYPLNRYYVGRGTYEALGAGIRMKPGDIAFRANFATVKDNIVIDRRAGRIKTEIAHKIAQHIKHINIEGVDITFTPTIEHRGVVLLRGKGLSHRITGTDPHKINVRWARCKPLNKKAKKTAEIINKYMVWVHQQLEKVKTQRKLKPNFLLLRGAGYYKKVPSIKERFGIRAVAVAGGALYKGVARFVGMDTPDIKGATGDKHTDLNAKFNSAYNYLRTNDLVFLHIKATDSFSHDKDCKGKQKFIEKVDKHILKLTKRADYIMITGDHSTPCTLGEHSADPVPFMLWGKGIDPDNVRFNDVDALKGALKTFYGKEVMKSIVKLIKNE